MYNTISLLLSDTYKQTHDRMYPAGLTRLVSYWTPRKSMLAKRDKMVFFGLQEFIIKFLHFDFNENFFKQPIDQVMKQYTKYMDIQLEKGNYDEEKISKLHSLGYLPILIRAIPEGTEVNMGIPCIEITNTHPDFAWVVQWIECLLQTELWSACNYATIGKMYYDVVKKFYDETTDGADPRMAMSDFGMRGMSCLEDSIKASTSWLVSFNKTSTVPALHNIDKFYDAECTKNRIGIGAVSTEHSVMGANYAVDGDEITFVKRLLTELYPNTSFSMVSDTYDYWNMINEILPACREEILNHNGKLLVRPDSGDIVDISVSTVEALWKIFGGTTNDKGYKVLDPHIGIIYGDGCTLDRVEAILNILKSKGFAANNIYFGIGAFCFHGFFEDGKLIVNTRDTFGVAMKATHGEVGELSFPIFKDPKTDTSNLKKSHKGCCRVIREDDGRLEVEDEFDTLVDEESTELKNVYKNGKLLKTFNLLEVRENLYK